MMMSATEVLVRAEIDSLLWEKNLWAQGYRYIAGIDEAGRGPLAGPVVAAACILPRETFAELPYLKDSKKLSPRQRETLVGVIKERALSWAVGSATEQEIDRSNILQATLMAMQRAVAQLSSRPDLLLIDGRNTLAKGSKILPPQIALVGGDNLSASVAAASILAKVTRDQIMCELHLHYPAYGFDQHKGYGTPAHLKALRDYGPCPLHRYSFAPVSKAAVQLATAKMLKGDI